MNVPLPLAYILHFGGTLSGVLGLFINLLVFVLIILCVWWIAGLVGIPDKIIRVICAILGLILILSLFSGCADYQKTVSSRSDSLSGYTKDGASGGAFTHTVTYR